MNRTGLVAALLVGLCVGVVFGVYPQLDIAISRLFFDETMRVFPTVYSLIARHMREVFNWTTALLVAPAFIALIVKIILPRRRMLMSARAALFLDRDARAGARNHGEPDPEGELESSAPE